ncbi:hypothetical protein AB4306_18490 [Vibrio splendidus]|uniref:hypothetical protein n=1 Tax=Vibrio splendidus TaxID=29497 RepID=UPI00076A832C|nr:hypothetical protein [Vibrio splendidus]PHX05468.1 hypothetical protein VSPL_28620 [Vibrio splendidus]
MQFNEINGQIIVPVYALEKDLSMAALGVYTCLCARYDLDVHNDHDIAEKLNMELSVWFSVKIELVNAKLITSSPITEEFNEKDHEENLAKIRQEIADIE